MNLNLQKFSMQGPFLDVLCLSWFKKSFSLSTMKNAMSSMLQAVQAGEEVTTDHIEIFKRKLAEDMEQRKRRRLDPWLTRDKDL